MKIGLKLWSPNKEYFPHAESLINQGVIDYIELTAVVDTFSSFAPLWRSLDIPYIIHAPTFSHGVSLSQKEKEKGNRKVFEEVFRFADMLKAPWIIIHSGGEGSIDETIRQIRLLRDARLAIENKPYRMSSGHLSNGYAPAEIGRVIAEAGTHFCFDFSHAICSANSLKQEPYQFIEEFVKLRPTLYHFMDGIMADEVDEHLHLGEGDYDLDRLFAYLPHDAVVTLETKKDYPDSLRDFAKDADWFKNRAGVKNARARREESSS